MRYTMYVMILAGWFAFFGCFGFGEETDIDYQQSQVEEGVCSLGQDFVVDNKDERLLGWFSLDKITTPQGGENVTYIKVVNKAHPEKVLYIGGAVSGRQAQVFRGKQAMECYRCTGNLLKECGYDPKVRSNLGLNACSNICPDELSKQNCVRCERTPSNCSQLLGNSVCHVKGGEKLLPEPGTPGLAVVLGLGTNLTKEEQAHIASLEATVAGKPTFVDKVQAADKAVGAEPK